MMDSALVVFGIKSLVRCCSAGKRAMDQIARDQEAVFPELVNIDMSRKDVVFSVLMGEEYVKRVIKENNLDMAVVERARANDAAAIDVLFLLAVKLKAAEEADLTHWIGERGSPAGATMIKQWSSEKEPATPLAQFLLTAADIALEYVSIHPKLLDGDESDKMLTAFAGNLARFIDDKGDFGGKNGLLSRLSAGFLRAGLEAISDHPQWVSSEVHLQAFISATTEPMLLAMSDATLADKLDYQRALDSLSGPVFKAALGTIAQHQAEFLGDDLVISQAMGALTQGVLLQAAQGTFKQSFSKSGLLSIYQAGLGVAVKHPRLFIENDGSAKSKAAEKLFVDVGKVLQDNAGQFGKELGSQLAATVIDCVSANLPGFADDDGWDKTLVEMTTALLSNLSQALNRNQPLKQVFSAQQWQDLSRVLLKNLAETPALVMGQREHLEGVVTAIATAMANDKHLLLRGDSWVTIAEIAAKEAASNPGRLFRLDPAKPSDMLAAQLISLLVTAGSDSLASSGKSGAVLYGDTLKTAIEIALQATSGNVGGLHTTLDAVKTMLKDLNAIVCENPDLMGSKEWLRAFRLLLMDTLEGNLKLPVTLDYVLVLLKGVNS